MSISKEKSIQLTQLININSPEAVLEEVKYNFIQFYNVKKFIFIRKVYRDFLDLYNGRYPGYKGCDIPYHDIGHTTDVFLAFSRMVDGYNISQKILPVEKVIIGLIAALFHDSGYIRKIKSNIKAKHIHDFVSISIDFIRNYFKKNGIDEKDYKLASNMLKYTDLNIDPAEIKVRSKTGQIVGYMLGTADLIGQMSSRTYLEKLYQLYDKARESKIIQKSSVSVILQKTIDLYRNRIKGKLEKDFGGLFELCRVHFRERYAIDRNLYNESIEKQVRYLEKILKKSPRTYSKKLKRKGEYCE